MTFTTADVLTVFKRRSGKRLTFWDVAKALDIDPENPPDNLHAVIWAVTRLLERKKIKEEHTPGEQTKYYYEAPGKEGAATP